MSKEIAEIAIWMIEAYYAETGVKHWNASQFYRLCTRLRCTPQELAALLRIEDAYFSWYISEDRFPGAVSLHFELIQRWLDELDGRKTQPVMPVHLIMHPTVPPQENNLPDLQEKIT